MSIFGPSAISIFGGTAPITTWSTQNSAVTASTDEDSEDYDLNAVIQKQAAKRTRLKAADHGAFRPDSVPVPPAFRTATPLDVNAFPNFLAFQSTKETPKNGGEDQVNGIDQEAHKGSTVNKTVDQNEKRKRRKELQNSRHSKHHKKHGSTNANANTNTDTNTNNTATTTKINEGNGIGSSHKRPILLDDSGDEGGEASTHIAKKMKTEGSLHLTRENLGALEASSHKPSASNTKVSGRKTHKGSKADRSSRKKERRHRSSLPGMDGPAGNTSKRVETASRTTPKAARVEKTARTESNPPRVDKPPKRNEGSHPQTAASAANASAQPRMDTEIWLQNLMRPVETRPTPIATIIGPAPAPRPPPLTSAPARPTPQAATTVIGPTPAPRPDPLKAATLTTATAPARLIPQATTAPALPNAQEKAEEFKRKRLEDNKRREEEIAAQKEAREREKDGKELPPDDAALFQAFAAKVPEAPKTRIVSDLPSNNYQRPEKGKRPPVKKTTPTQGSTNIFAPRPRPAVPARRPVGRPRKAPVRAAPTNSTQYRDDNDDGGEDGGEDGGDDEETYDFQPPPGRRPAARRRATTAAQPDYDSQTLQPAPLAPPRNIRPVPALAARGGPGRLVFKWTVCRTKPFIPQGVETRADYRLEMEKGTGYVSHVVHDKALALFNKSKKGVAGKSYVELVSRRAGVDLFDGWIKFKTGEVAYIWVEEGVVDLEELKGVEVDGERAEALMKQRWDVVSVHLMKKEKVLVKEVVQEKGKVLVIECGGEEEEGQGGNKHGDGNGDGEEEEEGLWGESSTAVQTPTNTTGDTPTDTPTTTTTPITTLQDLLESIETVPTIHGCFTTETDAIKAALETFLRLAEPEPSQPDEDKHYFEYTVTPYCEDMANEAIEKGTKDFKIEWDPDTNSKWNFFRLTVEVNKSELKGPIDISDLVVEGHEGVPSGGTAAASAILAPAIPAPDTPAAAHPAPTATNPKPIRSTQPAGPSSTLLKPSTPPPPSPERWWVLPVAPPTAKAPEKPPPAPATTPASNSTWVPNTATPATGTSSASLANQPTNTPPNPAPTKPAPPPVQAALLAAAQAARYAAAGLPPRPVAAAAGATTTPPFAQTRAPFAMVGDDESEVSEEE